MQLNEGVFSLNESGIQFLEKQKRTLKLSIPLTIILSLLITAGGIYRLGINLTSVLLLISANFLNYLLNYRYNNIRRKNILAQLVTKVTVTSSSLAIELFNKEQYNTNIEAIITDDPRILFSEYTRLKERWNLKLDNEKEAWLIPGFFKELQGI
jgi:hypothetical protein